MKKYYYFFNDYSVVETEERIDTTTFTDYIELTPQEVEFYLQHPNAAVYEIQQQMLYGDMPAIDEMKSNVEQVVSDYSLYTLERLLPAYQVQNALISLKVIESGLGAIYDDVKSNEILNKYTQIGQQCRTLFYQFKEELYKDITISEMNELEVYYKNLYDEIKNND